MDIVSKITGDSLTAAEFNQLPEEVENTIVDSGQIVNGGDTEQLSKGLSNFAASGKFYTDSGAANAYVLAAQGAQLGITEYENGCTIEWEVGNDNTGASTVNVNALGNKDLKDFEGNALVGGELIAGDRVTIQFDTGDNEFKLIGSTSITNSGFSQSGLLRNNFIINGGLEISQRGNYTTAIDGITVDQYNIDRWKEISSASDYNIETKTAGLPSEKSAKSWNVEAGNTSAQTLYSEQKVEDYAKFAGKTITVSAWVKSNVANAAITIHDGVGTTHATVKHTGGGAYEKITVTRTIDATPTELSIRIGFTVAEALTADVSYYEFTEARGNLGSIAFDYEPREISTELNLCYRYCISYIEFSAGYSVYNIAGVAQALWRASDTRLFLQCANGSNAATWLKIQYVYQPVRRGTPTVYTFDDWAASASGGTGGAMRVTEVEEGTASANNEIISSSGNSKTLFGFRNDAAKAAGNVGSFTMHMLLDNEL